MVTRRALLLLACLGAATGCAPHRGQPPPEAPSQSPGVTEVAAADIPADARVFEIDAARSEVSVRVGRAGPLARLGHNHVIVSAEESGQAWIGREPAGSGFELRLPVAAFRVDDAEARLAAGPGFEGEVPDEARAGTYRNMLRPEVLDAERHPLIVVQASRIDGSREQPVVIARIRLRDVSREIAIPVELRREPGTLTARGEFSLLQSDFGITPFSVGGGAIQVADSLQIVFVLVASAR